MSLQRVDHTAIAVRDLDEAIERYRRLLHIDVGERILVREQGVEVAFLPLADTQLELIQPIDDSSGVARFLKQRGEGLHHIGVLVEDIRAELDRLSGQGVELIDREPRRGVHGWVAFLHPRGTGGVLIELVQQY